MDGGDIHEYYRIFFSFATLKIHFWKIKLLKTVFDVDKNRKILLESL